jgi:hypothetical protein
LDLPRVLVLIHILSTSLFSLYPFSFILYANLSHYGESRSRCVYFHTLCLDHRVIDLYHYGGIGLHQSQLLHLEQPLLHASK